MDLHSTDTLMGMIEALDRPVQPLLSMFFPTEQVFETENVYLDKVDRARRLAPFVSPMVAGKAEKSRGYHTTGFSPAYVKPKHVVEPAKAFKRKAGERLTGTMSAQERFDLATADNLRVEDDQITRREEHMASEILRTGKVVVAGEDYPTKEVDFGRDAALTVALTGTARWGQSAGTPYQNLRDWATLVARKSGAHPGVVVMDPLSAALLQKDAELRAVLNIWRQDGGTMQFLSLATGAQGGEIVPIGRVGQFELYQYSQVYTDDAGTEANFMPDYTVIMGNPRLAEGVRLYGAIQDARNLHAVSRFPKQWMTEDPSQVLTMTQSSPLPILGRPDATFCATVG